MALINAPSAALVFSLKDETGSIGKMQFDVPYDTLASVAIVAADAMMALINSLTDCVVTGYSLTYSKRETAPGAAVAGSRVERKGEFQFLTDQGKFVTYNVPGITPALVDQLGVIDEDQLAVAAFITALTAVDAAWSDSNGIDIESFVYARERYNRTTRRQQAPRRGPD